jgi:hypothetical protein
MLFVKVGDDEQESRGAGDWSSVLPHVEQWASDVKRYAEIDAQIPDLWAEFRQSEQLLTDVQNNNAENTLFDPDELAEISRVLRGIKGRAQELYSLTNDQAERLEASVEEVEEASHRIGRKDWLLLFYGALLNLIISGILPPAVVWHILVSVLQGLGHLFGIGGPPPPIPPVA